MNKIAFIMGLMLCLPTMAELDPFSVYHSSAPQGCIEAPKTKGKLTLPDLIQIGICNNPNLSRNYMSVKTSEAAYGQSKSDYLPSLTATGTIKANTTKIEGYDRVKTKPYTGNVALSWLVYDFGGRGAKAEQMKSYLESAEFTYNAALHDTVLAINQAYFDLLSAQEVLKSNKESEKSFKKSYEESAKRFELGLVSASDKLLAKNSYDQSRLTVVKANNTLKKAQGALAVLLNLPPTVALEVSIPKKDKDITQLETKETVEEMINTALSLRPEILGQKSNLTAAERQIAINKAAGLPSLSAAAKVGYEDSWRRHHLYEKTSSVGLNLTVPLFTGFSDMYNIAKAKYQYRQAALSVAETEDSVRQDVWDSYQDYKTACDAYELTKNMQASAIENERVAFASYQIGKGNILELLTAGSQLSTAKKEVIVAFYAVLTSKANLYRAIGRF